MVDSDDLSLDDKLELMREALHEAKRGMEDGEVPIGCVIAVKEKDGVRIVARGYNRGNALGRKNAHAEIIAFENGGSPKPGQPPALPLDAERVILVSTLEPCIMCLGAAIETGVGTVLYALPAPANGGTGRIQPPKGKSPRIEGDILAEESRALFQTWLDNRRDEPDSEQVQFVRQLLSLA